MVVQVVWPRAGDLPSLVMTGEGPPSTAALRVVREVVDGGPEPVMTWEAFPVRMKSLYASVTHAPWQR
jgi:hypothetical protein